MAVGGCPRYKRARSPSGGYTQTTHARGPIPPVGGYRIRRGAGGVSRKRMSIDRRKR